MPPKLKNCNNVITVKQFTGTCWFNALLMILFYSDGMRKLLKKRSKYWKSSDKRLNNVYNMFKQILNTYTFTKKNKLDKFNLFDSIKPEHILETLNSLGSDFYFNPKVEEGWFAGLYLPFLLKLFHIDISNDVHIHTAIMQDNSVPEKYIMKNGKRYTIDSLLLANFNKEVCNRGHEIAGVTCKGERYIYNGWLRKVNANDNVTDVSLPCELMKNEWLEDTNDFCINPTLCKLDSKISMNIKNDLCFNFSKGERTYIYVADDIEDRPVDFIKTDLKNVKQYDSECVRKISNSERKYKDLLEKIRDLDTNDLRKDGNICKHVIYTEFKTTAKEIKTYLETTGDFKCAYTDSQKMQYMSNKENNYQSFGYLVSGTVGAGKPLSVGTRKKLLASFNERPDNIYGQNIRFMIIDGSFKEGIDLFDVKYVHIIEPPKSSADLKQVIGRATRLCGQKGLEFNENVGWPLDIYVYDTQIPLLVQQRKGIAHKTMSELAKSFAPEDSSFINDKIMDLIRKNSMDYKFNIELNNPSRKLSKAALSSKYTWGVPKPPINMCNNSHSLISLSPSQLFIQDNLTSTGSRKGILAMHSVGTGKTITAINTALRSFGGYTVLWVTRSSLKTDMQKDLVKFNIENGKIGDIPPISYKQFANLLEGKNEYYNRLVRINGKTDPLRKTFVIIDEAHKLIDDKDLNANERVDLTKLKKMIHNSYSVSGGDSCKVLIMTATPIVDSYNNFFDLIEMITEKSISKNERESMVTDKSKVGDLRKLIKSTVSFLDRSGDASQFAQPNLHNIHVPMSVRLTKYDTLAEVQETAKKLKKGEKQEMKQELLMYKELLKVDKSQERLLEEKCSSESINKKKSEKIKKKKSM